MQIVSLEDNLHEIAKPIFWKKMKKTSSIYHLLDLPRECEGYKTESKKKQFPTLNVYNRQINLVAHVDTFSNQISYQFLYFLTNYMFNMLF